MATLLQLDPVIPVYVTSKDNAYGLTLGWLDYGENHDLMWIVGLENKEVWIVPNHEIRMTENWSFEFR